MRLWLSNNVNTHNFSNYPIHCNFIFEPGIQMHQEFFGTEYFNDFTGDVISTPPYTRKRYNNAVALLSDWHGAFRSCGNFNPTSPVNLPCSISYNYMFSYCRKFNQPVSFPQSLDDDMVFDNGVSVGTYRQRPTNNCPYIDYTNTFTYCQVFNQPVTLNSEITGNCSNMFYRCDVLNSPITFTGNTGHWVGLDNMFAYCNNFNQPFNIPDTIPVNSNAIPTCRNMFSSCHNLNSPVSIGNNCRLCDGMFSSCSIFNQPVVIPNSANSCSAMFSYCTNFNVNVMWNDGCVDNTSFMFHYCKIFNQNILPLTHVTNAASMFSECVNFNKPVVFGNNLKDCSGIFRNCDKLSQSVFVPGTVEKISNMFGGGSGYTTSGCHNMIVDNVTFENLSNVKGEVNWVFCCTQFQHIDLDFSNSSITGVRELLCSIRPSASSVQNHYSNTSINLRFPESMNFVADGPLLSIDDGTWLGSNEPQYIHEYHRTITHVNITIPGNVGFSCGYGNNYTPFISDKYGALTGDIRIADFRKLSVYTKGNLISNLAPVYTDVPSWNWMNNDPSKNIQTNVNTQYINIYTDASVYNLFNISETLPVVSNIYFNGSERDWWNYSNNFYRLYPNLSFGYYEDGHLRQWAWIVNGEVPYSWKEIKIVLAFDIQILPYTL